MKLSTLLESIGIATGFDEAEISGICYDSRSVTPGCLFVCLRGSAVDGHQYAGAAAKAGAAAIVAEEAVSADGAQVFVTENTHQALAQLSAAFFGNPADHDITVIGITGTKGKTTTAYMVRSILESAGHKTGIIGTVGVHIGDTVTQIPNTTPASYEIQKFLRQMADSGCEYCVMEVSSIGLRDYRVYGFTFALGLFTNFSEDHIGGVEHKDMQEYLESKSMLFRMCKTGIMNTDDESGEAMLRGHTCDVRSYGFAGNEDYHGAGYQRLSENGFLGLRFDITGKQNFTADVGVPGRFNAYNALCAIACAAQLGVDPDQMRQGLRAFKVKGRMEPVEMPGNYTLLIDYAHNAVSMESLLTTLREYHPKRLVCMFGAGGNRPKVRRYEMGEVSGRLADLSVITEDNSRFEEVQDIIDDIKTGMQKTEGKYVEIPNRIDAIRYCIENARDGDIIVLAGKGHEDYQETRGVKHHLDEREVIRDLLDQSHETCRTK